GSYRYLLAFFALCDISTTLGHATLQPNVHMTSSGFYFFPTMAGNMIFGCEYYYDFQKHICNDNHSVPFDTVFCLMFIATYYQTFFILAYHFVYRYKTVTRGIGSSFTDDWKRRHWILLGIFFYVLYIGGFVVIVAIGMAPSEETR
ncbi:hypothetical protein PENTCL1PPCAC_16009, partial [Pristionchus entomophagus]